MYVYATQMWEQLYRLRCRGCGSVVETTTPNNPPPCPEGCEWVQSTGRIVKKDD